MVHHVSGQTLTVRTVHTQKDIKCDTPFVQNGVYTISHVCGQTSRVTGTKTTILWSGQTRHRVTVRTLSHTKRHKMWYTILCSGQTRHRVTVRTLSHTERHKMWYTILWSGQTRHRVLSELYHTQKDIKCNTFVWYSGWQLTVRTTCLVYTILCSGHTILWHSGQTRHRVTVNMVYHILCLFVCDTVLTVTLCLVWSLHKMVYHILCLFVCHKVLGNSYPKRHMSSLVTAQNDVSHVMSHLCVIKFWQLPYV